MDRNEQWQKLVDLLEEADAIQQSLLGETQPNASYEFHYQLNDLADTFVDWANEDGFEIG